jgi:hypothetical protein
VEKRLTELGPSVEEERISCVICKDGKKYKVNETLGYAFLCYVVVYLNVPLLKKGFMFWWRRLL